MNDNSDLSDKSRRHGLCLIARTSGFGIVIAWGILIAIKMGGLLPVSYTWGAVVALPAVFIGGLPAIALVGHTVEAPRVVLCHLRCLCICK